MAIERISALVAKTDYPDVTQRALQADPNLLSILPSYVSALETIDDLYRLQVSYGFYPASMTQQEYYAAAVRDPRLKSSYLPIRREKGELKAVGYRKLRPYREKMDRVADDIERAIRIARQRNHPEQHLIEDSLGSQVLSFKQGNFEGARVQHLNSRRSPSQELVTGLFDKYQDTKLGIKYSFQGWLIDRDVELSRYFNEVLRVASSQRAVAQVELAPEHRIRVGNVLMFAGLAKDRRWNGNTLPSEDHLRRDMGSLGYIFPNVLENTFNRSLRPGIMRYVPEVTKSSHWEVAAKKAAALDLVLHEGFGHSHVDMGTTETGEVKGFYMPMKELACEILAHVAVLSLPERLANPVTKKMVLANSFAWWRADIDDYLREQDPVKKATGQTYARAGAMMINYYHDRGAIRVGGQGEISIVDMNLFKSTAEQFSHVLKDTIQNERTRSGFIEGFVRRWSTEPISFFPDNGDAPSEAPQSLVA